MTDDAGNTGGGGDDGGGTGNMPDGTSMPDDANGGGTGMEDATTRNDGGSGDTGGGNANAIDFSGTVQVHPVAAAINDNLDLADTKVSLVAASTALSGAEPNPVDTVDGSPSVTEPGGGSGSQEVSWSIEDVDKREFTLAATGLVDDGDSASNDRFIRTATGIAQSENIGKSNADSTLYAIDAHTETRLAQLVGDNLDGYEAGSGNLIGTGFILFLVVDSNGDPVEGAQIKKGDNGNNDVQKIVYPSADFQSAASGSSASTSSAGVAVVPDVSQGLPPTFTASKSNMSFSAQPAAGPDGYAFVAVLQETSSN